MDDRLQFAHDETAIESNGQWDEARASAEPVTFAKPLRWWQRWRQWRWQRWVGTVAVTLALLMLVAAVLIPNLLASKICINENASVQNLKAIATAQAQYIKKYDCYADAAWRLHAANTLIAADLNNAFEDWQANGDSRQPQPKAGYIYRMLHGAERQGPYGFYRDLSNFDAGMDTWAATCRAADPTTGGEYQYFITEAGTVYKFPEPAQGSLNYKQFLLDRVPPSNQPGWTTAK